MATNRIFFSYSFKDEEIVLKVRKIIESIIDEDGNQKYSVFMASDPISGNKSGRSWNAQEKREMLNSFLILYFLSENSLISDGASQELYFYFNTMRKRGNEKFLYISLNDKSMGDSVLDYMKTRPDFVDDVKIETIINRYETILDEPDFRDNHLFIKYSDQYFKERLYNSILGMFDAYNGFEKKENKYEEFIKKLEERNKLQENDNIEIFDEKNQVESLENSELIETKSENSNSNQSLADIFTSSDETKEMKKVYNLIKECLISSKITAEIINSFKGDSYTLFELKAKGHVSSSKLILLKDEISFKLEKLNCRIIYPLPGKVTFGIEIPNDKREVLRFGDMLTPDFLKKESGLVCALGRNVYKEKKYYDISKMPHCLVAGATCSGKSNILHTMIVSLLLKYSPEEVKLVLIDPKKVEFKDYCKLPHLMYPLVSDTKAGISILEELVQEINSRYKTFLEKDVKRIEEYNRFSDTKMPYILIVIDEYSHLVLEDKNITSWISKIALRGRGAGVHIILSTQRPSLDVIDSNIKSNFNTRIAARCATQMESTTIINHGGAELLLGQGDIIISFDGVEERIQAAYIYPDELKTLCEKIVLKFGTVKSKEIPSTRENIIEEKDSKVEEALNIIYENGYTSISMLQRKLSIGFARSFSILEKLKESHIVKQEGSKTIPIVTFDEARKKLNIN